MGIRGHHRVRSGARLLAAPVIAATLAAVVAAVLIGHAGWIAAAAGLAVACCVLVAVAFDRELVSTRRSHAEDRAKLARLYAERYAAWRRMDRASQVAAAAEDEEPAPSGEVSAAAPDPIVASSLAPGPRLTAGTEPKPESAAEPAVEPADVPASGTAAEPAVEPADVPADVPSLDSATVPQPASAASEHDLWPDLADAPTVVDLVGWEERVREATEHRPAEGADSELGDVDDRRYA